MKTIASCMPAVLSISLIVLSAAAEVPPPQTPPVLLQMIRDDAVHRELELSDKQIVSLMSALREVDPPWFRSRILPSERQRDEITILTSKLRGSLAAILSETQLLRLRQLEHQALGTRMVLRDEVARGLGVSEDQLAVFVAAFRETDRESQEAFQLQIGGCVSAGAN